MATRALLTPALTAPLLYLLTLAPDHIRAPLLAHMQDYISPQNVSHLITGLKALLGLGLLRTANRILSVWAQNNFRLRPSEAHRYDWPREIAVVTGAASGFGRLVSEGLCARGVRVMAIDLAEKLPQDMVDACRGKVSYYRCDVTDRQAVIDLAERIKHEHGVASVLVNNAGISGEGDLLSMTEGQVRKVFDVNIVSHFWTLQAFLPGMVERKKGHVVALASMASFVSTAGLLPYSCTKSAVLALHEGIQQEARVVWNTPEIKWSVVHPTFAATAMVGAKKSALEKGGAMVIDPHVVSDAILQQVFAGKGGQIICAPGSSWLSGMRAWPHWLSQALMHLGGDPAMRRAGKAHSDLLNGATMTT